MTLPSSPTSPQISPPHDNSARVTLHGAAAVSVIGIFVLLLLGAVHYARDFLLPVVTSLLLFFVFAPVQRRFHRYGLPKAPVAAVLVLSLLLGIAAIFFLVSGPIMQVVNNFPDITRDVMERFNALRGALLSVVSELREDGNEALPDLRSVAIIAEPVAEGEGGENGDGEEQTDDEFLVSTATGAMSYLANAPAAVAQVVFMLVLLYFLLSSADLIYLKIVQSFDGFADKRAAFRALREIELNLGGYLGTITLINAGLGASITAAMWALDMPVPVLFGVLGFALNYIPYVGAVTGVLISAVVSLLWFDDLASMLMVTGAYLALTTIEGQLITPLMLARRLRMNIVLVFLSVAFWAWMWSFLGMLIAVPLLVAFRVIAEQVPGMGKLSNLLSGDPAQTPTPKELTGEPP
ncbi:AI-2E family transporter [Pararhodobacter sp. SW119]|uniref:AI-2E family transporter n=1 Tax=Pararhodobacter sp. SW119 TaxID=2780075 RepID=UPI001AE00108|nr:AI-2E family transporter [Pararhodobacter sp. SW119]